MRTLITTIGTSLLTNRIVGCPWAGWKHGQPLPDANTVAPWLLDADPVKASAETHTWKKLGLLDRAGSYHVVLLHTRSPDGKFCADRLASFLQALGVGTTLDEIVQLDPSREAGFNLGLAELARQVAVQVENAKARGAVAIAATGGFKAETAMVTLVGALLDVPVHYVHESFSRIVTIEPIPIGLDLKFLQGGPGKALLAKLSEETALLPRASLESLLAADGRLGLLLETTEIDGQDHVALNAMGQIALQLVDSRPVHWPEISSREPAAKIILQPDHHRPNGWEPFVDKLARNSYVTHIRYEGGAGRSTSIETADDNETDLRVVYSDGSRTLALRVGTTAENGAQRKLVIGNVRRWMKVQ